MTMVRDRRETPRWTNGWGGAAVLCRIRPGHDARIVDLSPAGVLLETDCRLVPGSTVAVQIEQEGRRCASRALVVRCSVAVLRPDLVLFRGALLFDRPLAVSEPRPFVRTS